MIICPSCGARNFKAEAAAAPSPSTAACCGPSCGYPVGHGGLHQYEAGCDPRRAPSPSRDAAPWAERRRAAWEDGWRAATERAAKVVERHCDCTHADLPGLVRLSASDDPIYGMPAAPADQSKETP